MASTKSVNTGAEVAGATKSAVKLPHEQDESVGMTDGIPSAPMQQAHRDVLRGLRDTDRGPVVDATYDKLKRTTP